MKSVLLLAASLILTAPVFASAAAAEPAGPIPEPSAFTSADHPASAGEKRPWSMAGEWQVTHPNWQGLLTLRPDGTFSRANGDGGKWNLIATEDHLALELVWDSWATEIADMLAPDFFRGKVRKGPFELRRGGQPVAEAPATAPPPRADEFNDPELKKKLSDSTWLLRDGKHFTLHADGTTSADWHDRKGFWRLVAADRVQLTIQWRIAPPATVTLNADVTLLRWSDEDWGQVAKRVPPEPASP